MKLINQLKLIELIAFYIGLFGVYVFLPEGLAFIKHIIAPTMLVLIGVIFLNSLQYLSR